MKVFFSPTANTDLLEIALYIARDNPDRALGFVDALESACCRLGRAPKLGTPREDLGFGLRMWPYRRYLIFYRLQGDIALRIERIIHSSRNVQAEDLVAPGPH